MVELQPSCVTESITCSVSVIYPHNSQSDPLYNITYIRTYISKIPGTDIFKYVSYVNVTSFQIELYLSMCPVRLNAQMLIVLMYANQNNMKLLVCYKYVNTI